MIARLLDRKLAEADKSQSIPEEPPLDVEAATAQLVRGRTGKDLPASAEVNPVEQGLLANARRYIETLARRCSQELRHTVDAIAQTRADTLWVGLLREQFRARIDVLVSRAARRLRAAASEIEGVVIARRVIEINDEILIPTTAAMKRSKRRAMIVFSGMIGGDATINGVVFWSIGGVGGGLLGAWGVAILMATVIVGLGKALGLLALKMKQRRLPLPAMLAVGVGVLLIVTAGGYFALAMGIARVSGSFDIIHFLMILRAPAEHIGALGLTTVSAGFFVAASLLSYRFADVNERYERVVIMERAMKEDCAEDLEEVQDVLLAISSIAATAFEFYREEQQAEQRKARYGVAFVDRIMEGLEEAADQKAMMVETAIRKHRRLVVGLRPDAPAYFRDEPNIRADITRILADAKTNVAAVRDRMRKIEAANISVESEISAALLAIQTAVREALNRLDAAVCEVAGEPVAVGSLGAQLPQACPSRPERRRPCAIAG